jgi:hypothetical protein
VTFALPYFLGTLACLWVGFQALPILGFAVAVPWFGWSQWKRVDRSIEWLRS